MKKYSRLFMIILVMSLSSALMAQTSWNYISPKPGSKYINPENAIAFRHGDVLELSSVKSDLITVRTDSKGEISGSFILSSDMRTLIFYPDQKFELKDKVRVSLAKGIKTVSGQEMEGLDFYFSVKEVDNSQMLIDYYESRYSKDFSQAYKNLDLSSIEMADPNIKSTQEFPPDFSGPYVTEFDNPAPGDLLATTFSFNFSAFVIIPGYIMIVDKYGTPVFYRKAQSFQNDFKILPGNKLAVSSGFLNPDPVNNYWVMDSHFNLIDTLYMGNGYMVDGHDLVMQENGNYFMMAYDPQPVGMDTVVPGGSPVATVIGLVIQELDADDNVIFQWRSWDHYEITDCSDHVDLLAEQIDYVHGNAIEIDTDGNIMMSQRHFDEITKIDRNSGEIIWRFGPHAKQNMFTFTNDTTGFRHQHDIRRNPDGRITLYDNGNHHMPPFSQSLEYEIDEVNLIATKTWNYINDPVIFAMATGSSRKLENGNTMIGWGFNYPISFTEVTPEKEKSWELNFARFGFNYRGVKEEWVTDLFETNYDTINYGEFSGYTAMPRIFKIFNNADHEIQITSTHNHWDSYYVSTPLPLSIPANGEANMTVNFHPTMAGQINDVLTLNYESMFLDSLPQSISRQIVLMGSVPDAITPVATLSPANDAIDVSQTARPLIAFDEPVVKFGGGTIKTSDLKDMIIFKEGDANGEDVQFSAFMDAWKTVITITPDTLKPLTSYYVELKANSVQDNSGNVLTDAKMASWLTEEEQGIPELEELNVSVFPNPTDGVTYMKFEEELPQQIRVVSITGRTISTIENPSDSTIEIDLSDKPTGIYVVQLYFDVNSEPRSLKIVKQ